MKFLFFTIAILTCFDSFSQIYKNEVKIDLLGSLEKEARVVYERYCSEKWAFESSLSYFINSQNIQRQPREGISFRNTRYTHFRLSSKYYFLSASSSNRIFLGLGLGGRYFLNNSNLRQTKNFFTRGNQILFTSDNSKMLGFTLQQGGKWNFFNDKMILELETAMLINLIDFTRRADASLSVNINLGYAF